ncbi:uncharacterized protein LOC114526591 [Dendronephthya gigantea]|uniref:uncharacterized protein LOC114526591 n=1 Tax=Dendronephthya gigantea TaxID=151771 RepID=UPI00106BD2DF|nr:uncharacterized protein LOC114526591 [Dendronephthya gigantea]
MADASGVSICSEHSSRTSDQPVSDLDTSEQSSVNRAILMSLNRLNENFASFSHQYEESFVDTESTPADDGVDNPENIDIQADIESLIQADKTMVENQLGQNVVADANECEILQYDKQLDINIEVKGPTINEKVSSIVDKLRLKRISQEQAKAIMKRHNTPENVQIRLPKCETTIWNEIPGRARSTDLKFQTTQAALLGAINCQLEVTNSLLSANVSKDVLTTSLDGITLAMTANFELNQRRRDAIRPHFKTEFAKGLCSTTSPADEFLFGGDTAKRVKEMAELNKHKVCKGPSPVFRGRGQRFQPYNTRGVRSGATRGRYTRGSYNSFPQRQNFPNTPQTERKAPNQKPSRN